MIDKIEYKGNIYPKFQSEGFASQFVIPYAKKTCKGIGVDVGCNRLEWAYAAEMCNIHNITNYDEWYKLVSPLNHYNPTKFTANSFPIDPIINGYDALNFPDNCKDLDYIFSSHCLEHVDNWVGVLDYWTDRLKKGGVLFLYLPDYSQVYWRPWNNRKHVNMFSPQIIEDYLKDKGYSTIFKSGVDLNNAFAIMAEK